jgi:hypothetical protein|tara:strand:- start:890 stop:1093 length:204 start_codon:yes stop_codon:yes gene_type:complete
MKIFILVISLWGYNGSTWVYTGNQLILQEKFNELKLCEEIGRKFMKFDMNKYFTFKVQCIEDINKDI